MKVVAYVTDLMDRSRFSAIDATVEFARSVDDVVARSSDADIVVLDLSKPDALDVLRQIGDVKTVGYASHVDTAGIETAKAAGIDQVMPRSRFFSRIVEVLRI